MRCISLKLLKPSLEQAIVFWLYNWGWWPILNELYSYPLTYLSPNSAVFRLRFIIDTLGDQACCNNSLCRSFKHIMMLRRIEGKQKRLKIYLLHLPKSALLVCSTSRCGSYKPQNPQNLQRKKHYYTRGQNSNNSKNIKF